MSYMNKVILIGNLGSDPEGRLTANSTQIGKFRIATTETFTKNGERAEHTEWHQIVTFGKLATTCCEYLSKGRKVLVEGKIRSSEYTDNEGITRRGFEIIADNVQFLDSKKAEEKKAA